MTKHTHAFIATLATLTALTYPATASVFDRDNDELKSEEETLAPEPFFNAFGADADTLMTQIRALGAQQLSSGPVLDRAGAELGRLVAQYQGLRPSGLNSLAAICQVLDTIPCEIDLKLGTASPACALAGVTQLMQPIADTNGDLWREAVLRLTFDTCSQGCVTLDYEGTGTLSNLPPTGWTVDVADSDTCNGFCGNQPGDIESAAEVQILEDSLQVCNHVTSPPNPTPFAGTVHRQDLNLVNGAYKMCFGNQRFTFGQPASNLVDPSAVAQYFKIPDTYAAGAGPTCAGAGSGAGNTDVWIGLNRVVQAACGLPSSGRYGAGLRRATVTLK